MCDVTCRPAVGGADQVHVQGYARFLSCQEDLCDAGRRLKLFLKVWRGSRRGQLKCLEEDEAAEVAFWVDGSASRLRHCAQNLVTLAADCISSANTKLST